MVLLAVYYILLSKYSGQSDILVGTPIAGRRHLDLQNIIGVFVNMLVLRNFPQKEKRFSDFLKEIKKNTINAYENQDYHFELLVRKLAVPREYGRNPLFNAVFDMHDLKVDIPSDSSEKTAGLDMEEIEYTAKMSDFDLVMQAKSEREIIGMSLEYASRFFTESTSKDFIRLYLEILQQVIDNVNIKIGDIEVCHTLSTAGRNFLKRRKRNSIFKTLTCKKCFLI